MPATLDQAFQSPFHKYVNPSGTSGTASTSTYDIRNPNNAHAPVKPPIAGDPSYFEFQNNYRVKNAVDIVSEADEIKSVYDTSNPSQNQTQTQGRQTHHSESSDHDCNYLIAKLLSCSRCRNKLKDLLRDDTGDTHTHDDTGQGQMHGQGQGQKGGGGILGDKSLLINIILGVMLILLIDFVLR